MNSSVEEMDSVPWENFKDTIKKVERNRKV